LEAAGNTLDSPSTQMTREFFHSVLGKGIFELGRAHQEAKESCIWRLGSIAWLRYVYFEVNLFGDPELRLRVTDLPPSSVDAGDDMITWSGQAVQLDPNVVGEPLTYVWRADPNDGVEFSDPNVPDPNVTITKTAPTGDAATVKLTLVVNDEYEGTMTIDVYDDACQAAIGKGLAADNPGDFDGNCITSFADLAVMATKWLNDTGLTGPVAK
jgi:hypothetical protein